MFKFKKVIKMLFIIVSSIVATLVLGGILFVNFSPQFGSSQSEADQLRYEKTGHYKDGTFYNLNPTKMAINASEMGGTLIEFIKGSPNRQPNAPLPIEKIDSSQIVSTPDSVTQLNWFGHSAFLLQMDGKKILIDPMLGNSPSPMPFIGSKRYTKELPIEIERLPKIDAVIISHDHYDHLDYGSIMKLKDKVEHFYTPLAVGNHLLAWGIAKEKVTQLDWWEEVNLGSIKLVCTPSQHFSGRGLTDRNATLWSSWVISGMREKIYFSGDSGYGNHFKEIGEKYGPFNIALMECGQYNEKWADIHMFPEQSAMAARDLGAETIMPIHWGAFSLALHSWTDPIKRVIKKSKELNLNITTPKIGESVLVGSETYPSDNWWATNN